MNRKICVITGTRAEYGLLRWVMEAIRDQPGLELQLIATGMHLSPDFGSTYLEIEKDGFVIDRKVEILLSSDSPAGISKSMGLGLIGFAEAFQSLTPDILVVLGDRFEIFAAVSSALVFGIPVAHLHGGETTEGAFDESIRHSITKMSQLHFVATEEYRRRVLQLGEDPERVFLVGGLGVDSILKLPLLDRHSLEASLGLKFAERNLLITYHPVTLENNTSCQQLSELLAALELLEDTLLIFTMPNADTGSRALKNMVDEFVKCHSNAVAFDSLGHLRYLSSVAQVDAVVGNSSSGLTEVPSFARGTINVGDRQKGRIRAASVIDCKADRLSISAALEKLYSAAYQSTLKTVENPYGEGGASAKIVKILRDHPLDSILKKKFYDLKFDIQEDTKQGN